MLKFYKKAAAILVGLVVLSLLVGYVCIDRAFLHDELLPAQESVLPWKLETESDAPQGGGSSITVNDASFSLDFDLFMTRDVAHPYASLALVFHSAEGEKMMADLSQYTSLSFRVKCSPHNVLWFGVFTIEAGVTRLDDFLTYRAPSVFFSCDEDWTHVEIDLRNLETPQWWLSQFGIELSRQEYRLDKVPKFAFGTSFQSPLNTVSNIKLHELAFNGRDWRYLYALSVLMLLLWGGFMFWFFRQHTKALILDIKEKLQKDRPLVAYQQLSIEPKRDSDKKLILSFLVTEYANPDLSLETMVAKLGVSRTRINDILKEELGYTFTAYLNKLRLTEAARLLSENDQANVAEIAYSVGYNNVSYFNKLFKNEYGCTPKVFRNIYNK